MTTNTLVVRLGAMGDIIHTLPAVASLKAGPPRRIVWIVAARWLPLLEGNPHIDEVIVYERTSLPALFATWRRLRNAAIDTAIDFQGLLQSALVGKAARPRTLIGFDRPNLREPLAAWLYDRCVSVAGPHRVERNLQLAAAAGGASFSPEAWIPPGRAEGSLPNGEFVLTTPFAGWPGKEWPLALLDDLGGRLRREGIALIANVPADRAGELRQLKNIGIHVSTLAGLIEATRRASAVIAPDSGPLHLAAALHKPGVGLFGPTDPHTHGPFGGSLAVLRAPGFGTTYKRHRETHASMHAITVDDVFHSLIASLARSHRAVQP